MALYELSDEMLALATFPAVDGGSVSVGELLKSTRPLSPGHAIVAALLPGLEPAVFDALGRLVDANMKLGGYTGGGERVMHINASRIAAAPLWVFDSEESETTFYSDGGRVTGKPNRGPALLPAIEAAIERLNRK